MTIAIRSVEYRDIPAMAAIRAQEWQKEEFWKVRIEAYLRVEHSPQQALAARAGFVAIENGDVVGFVTGHLTKRYACDAELQWINVAESRRGMGVAGLLLAEMAKWFVTQEASRVCVNVEPNNAVARSFYAKYGAQPLNEYWMVWEDIGQIPSLRR